ncbi:MAG: PASTA domain-containing protein [Ruminococcus sp.]|nr:PASTA domain-containing protein [Ruminococcus sp.]
MPLCMGCLNEISRADAVCRVCGFDNSKSQQSPFLPYGTLLNGKYVVAKNLDTNGESTRYLGYNNDNGKVVTIREFLPIGLFDRGEGERKLFVSPNDRLKFAKAMSDFQNYFDAVSAVSDTSAMTQILDTFTENNTAYVIEESNDLIPFSQYLEKNGGHLEWDAARPMFMPLVTLLENLHKNGVGHYAVSPSNLFVSDDGKLKLSGFSSENERKRGTMLKSQLFSGCAAPEQYRNDEPLDIAADIYGFTASLFYALTGNLPANAKDREKDARLLISTNTVKRLPPHVVSALANGLQMKKDDRISDFDELRAQLSVASTVQAIQDEISRTASMTPVQRKEEKKSTVSAGAVGVVATIVALLIFGAAGLWWLGQNPLVGVFAKSATTAPTQAPTASPDWTGPVVPDYVGKSYEEVVAAVEADSNLSLKIAADGEYSDTVAEGNVISQQPAPGEAMTSGSSVIYIVLSKGPQLKILPEVKDKSVSAAAEKLTDLGFVVVQEVEYDSEVAEGKVIDYKDHSAGDKIESGSEIVLRVSLGNYPQEEVY